MTRKLTCSGTVAVIAAMIAAMIAAVMSPGACSTRVIGRLQCRGGM